MKNETELLSSKFIMFGSWLFVVQYIFYVLPMQTIGTDTTGKIILNLIISIFSFFATWSYLSEQKELKKEVSE